MNACILLQLESEAIEASNIGCEDFSKNNNGIHQLNAFGETLDDVTHRDFKLLNARHLSR
jgi:hypothetical protein